MSEYNGQEPARNGLLGSWEGRAIGLMDLDAFFASVEMRDNPSLKGKPVIVGGRADARGVVSTASYEARAFGVHSAMPSAQAERLCPQAIWVRPHFDRYREVSDQVMAILADETPFVDQVSIDEAFFDVTPGRFSSEHPALIAMRIRDRVSELGVTCSIGLGRNKTVAKIASERQKPRGLTVVYPGTEREFLAPLPVRAISGIGKSAEAALARRGIRTVGELARAPKGALKDVFGVNAELMRLRASGMEESLVTPYDTKDEAKSVSNERTFAQDLTERAEVVAALRTLAASVGRRLREKGLAGRTVSLKVRYAYNLTRERRCRLPHPTDDENIFGAEAERLLDELWHEGVHVRLMGVGMSDFDRSEGVQTDLFCEVSEDGTVSSDRRALSVAVDEVLQRFGKGSVEFGRERRFRRD